MNCSYPLPMPGRSTVRKYLFIVNLLLLSAVSVFAQPAITQINPVIGPPGTSVTITGSNFSTVPTENKVYFGVTKATVTAATTNMLTVTAPLGANAEPVSVMVNGKSASSRQAFNLTYSPVGKLNSHSITYTNSFALTDMWSGYPSRATRIATADFDMDGVSDAAAISTVNATHFAVLRNNGTPGAANVSMSLNISENIYTGFAGGMASGDVDGDGKPDLVVSYPSIYSVNIYRNTSSGIGSLSFATTDINLSSGDDAPGEVALGDLDGDGLPELIVGSGNTSLRVYKNTSTPGTPSWVFVAGFNAGTSPINVAVADIDGDGLKDIMSGNTNSNTVSVLRNTSAAGVISFDASRRFTVVNKPERIAAGDLNGDNTPDIVVSSASEGAVTVLKNTSVPGNISFNERLDITGISNAGCVSIGDLTGEGLPDLVIANIDGFVTLQNASVAGTIAFSPANQSKAGVRAEDLRMVDMNMDGKLDVMASMTSLCFSRNDCGLPFIDAFTPASAGYGQQVSIKGIDLNGASNVSFGGVPADSFRLISNDSIVAYVKNGNSGNITITTPAGVATLSGFTYIPNPVVTSVTPMVAKTGDVIEIRGYSLKNVNSITIGGEAAASYTINSATSISVVVGAGSNGNIVVGNPSGSATIPGFVYDGPPDVQSFTPTSGGRRTAVIIYGKEFTGATAVTIGGKPVDGFSVRSNYIIDANVGDNASGAVSVTTPYGTDTLGGFTFNTPSAITSFSPVAADSGKVISIYGINFADVTNVFIGGVEATSFTVISPSLIRAVVPKTQSGVITVYGYYGYVSLSGFVYSTGTQVVALRPSYGTKGSTIKIVGANFRDSSTVTIGGVPAQSFTVESDTVINAVVGDVTNAPGIWPVAVASPNGSATYSGLYSGPVIHNISKLTAAAGDALTISGGNFNTTAADNTVYFGGIKANVTAASENALTVNVPAGGNLNTLTVTNSRLTAYSAQQLLPRYEGKDSAFTANSFTRADYVSGPNPGGPALADVDGDGLNDIIEVQNNGLTSVLSVFRNTSKNGAITMAARTDRSMSVNARTLKMGDIDGDGRLDVLAICTSSNFKAVYAFINVSTPGNIQFNGGYMVDNAGSYNDITVGDYDGDGKVDFAVSTNSGAYVAVYRNTSNGSNISFLKHASISTPTSNLQLVSGDFDRDGKTDIAWANNYPAGVYVWRNMSYLGIIRFGDLAIYNTTDGAATSITAADMNDDGKIDLIAGHNNQTISVFRNNSVPGNISFTDRVNVKMNNYVYDVSVADMDGDGKPDLSVASNQIALVKNKTASGGIFEFAPVVELADQGYVRISSGDLDRDGKPDLIGLVTGDFSKMSIFRNNGSREGEPVIKSFAPAKAYAGDTITITGSNFTGVTNVGFGDTAAVAFTVVNDTLIKAVVSTGSNGNVFVTNNVTTVALPGFQLYPQLTSFSPASGRVNDLITITGKGLGAGTATLGATAATVVSSTATSMTVRVGEGYSGYVRVTIGGLTDSLPGFNFIPPVPVINSFTPDTVSTLGQVRIFGRYLINVTGVTFGGVSADSFRAVNRDTLIAYIGQGATGQVGVTTATGSGLSAKQIVCLPPHPIVRSFSPESGSAGSIVTINGLGFNQRTDSNYVYFGAVKADVIAASATTLQVQVPFGATYEPLSVTANGATGYATKPFALTFTGGDLTDSSFTISGSFTTGNNPVRILANDVNGDKNTDLLVVNGGSNFMSVVKNTSKGDSLTAAAPVQVGAYTFDGFLHDMDGDGKKDLFMQTNSDLYAVAWVRNLSADNNVAFGSNTLLSYIGLANYAMTTGDIDGDGHTDFVLSLTNFNTLSTGIYNGNNKRISFVKGATPAIPYRTYDMLLGDLDGDGKPELITAYDGYGMFSVFRNTSNVGASNWADRIDYRITDGGNFNRLKMADLDGDGKQELLIANSKKWLNVFKNNSTPGNISLTETAHFPMSSGTNGEMSVGDLTGDGKPEVALPDPANGKLTVLQNTSTTGSISFAPKIDYSAGTNPIGVAMADINNDGRLDLVVSNNSNKQLSILLNKLAPVTRPVITSFAADTARSGNEVRIFGKHLSGATAVNFGNVPATSFIVSSDTTIDAMVGAGASGKVSVVTPSGADSLGGFVFMQVKINDFTPASAAKGDTVVINGKGFSGITGVYFGGGYAAASYTITSDTRIVAVVGIGVAGAGAVTVTGPWGTDVKTGFTYLEKPTIQSFSPVTAAKGTTVTIRGTKLSGVTGVSFGNVLATSYQIISDFEIRAVVGNGNTGAVKVATANYSAEANGFTFLPAPLVTAFLPAQATTGDRITIYGQNFTNVTSVSLGGVEVAYFNVLNATTIQAYVGNGATGNVVVTTAGGIGQRSGFIYTTPTPNIAGFTPQSGTAGTKVTVTGEYFQFITGAAIGNVPVDSFKVISDNELSFIVPVGKTASVTLYIANGSLSFGQFVYDEPVDTTPVIRSFNPVSGATGDVVEVYGKNFTHVSSVTLGGTPAAGFTIKSDSVITLTVGTGANGAVKVSGTAGVDSLEGFTYIPPVVIDKTPHIYSFNPVSGGTGTVVTLKGKNFGYVSSVTLGGTSAGSFTLESDSVISLVVGNGASGSVKVSGTEGVDSLGGFTYIPPVVIDKTPHIYSFSPVSGGTGTIVKVRGKNFNDISSVTLGGMPVNSFILESDSVISLVVGNGASGAVKVSGTEGVDSLGGFVFIPLPPVIDSTPVVSSFYPATAAVGTTVTIEGKWFLGVTKVSFGGVLASSFSVVSDTKIEAVVGEGNTGNVEVKTVHGTGSLNGFTYIIPPTPVAIKSFSPVSGGLGTSVTINGSGFTGALNVSVGDTAVSSFVIVDDSTIMAIVGAGGTGEVSVMTATDTATLGTFTYIGTPDPGARSAMSLYPNPVTSGNTITIQFPVTDKDAEVTLVDINGNVLRTIKVVAGTGKVNIVLDGLHGGTYRIVWRNGTDKMSRPLMIVE
ncbi:IPT/TIG domain-containing protein [Chitinophaga sp. S165]|uniref:IPT/TIG domain-containing protein n=1 Tax=Chitinophaga sp. S165 TaxID=2135462 RepID=UPI000D719170|nr:IPT/TIG domain-containing protein [Chitinophaga sp. S165]PWV45805.1 IPT/TIG domain-containing protein [Chitinophaga sp. S165]